MKGHFKPTPEQTSIIKLNEGSYLVSAPPGSGKTEVLTQRIIRLLQDSRSEPFRILALTFTTKAAESMRTRIEAQARNDWRRVTAMTFHAFCLDVLQHYGDPIGISSNVTIYENDDDRIEILAQGLTDDGYSISRSDDDVKALRRLLASIGRLKKDLIPPSATPDLPGEERVPLRAAYTAYARTLQANDAVDFDDLLRLTYRLFTDHPRVARHYRRLYRYILVDEAQDTSRAQYEVLKALCGSEHRNVMLVADADQFIYRFAGASDRYLRLFQKDFEANVLSLTNNFRCAEAIVKVANALIAHNTDRIAHDKPMQSETLAKGKVTASSYADEAAEAVAVAELVQDSVRVGLPRSLLHHEESGTITSEDICVLARARYLLKAILSEFDSRRLQYQFGTGEAGLFDSGLYRGVYYALRVIANPRDLLSRENLLANAGDLSDEVRSELRDVEASALFDQLHKLPKCALNPFIPIFNRASMGKVPIESLVKDLSQVQPSAIDELQRAVQVADAQTMVDRWKAYARHVELEERNLQGFLGELSLAGRATVEGKGTRILTVHAAKGLEFKLVILVGMNEGSFPDFRSVKSKEGLEEERRNAYVAITRAARRLHVTRPRTRLMPWGDERSQEPSQFLAEMGLAVEDVQVSG